MIICLWQIIPHEYDYLIPLKTCVLIFLFDLMLMEKIIRKVFEFDFNSNIVDLILIGCLSAAKTAEVIFIFILLFKLAANCELAANCKLASSV